MIVVYSGVFTKVGNMDHYGIGTALRAMLCNYSQTARQTGRTTSLIESVKTGDCVVFANTREAKRVQNLLKERNIHIDCVTAHPADAPSLYRDNLGTSGRMLFDHTWVEEFYRIELDKLIESVDRFQTRLSHVDPEPEVEKWTRRPW